MQVQTSEGGSWTTLATPGSQETRSMSPVEIDVSAYNQGSVRLRFDFDTVDGWGNGYEGWVIDDVMVTADGRGPLAVPGGPYSGQVAQPIALDGSRSLDPEGDTLTFAWDFGDGATGEGPKPTHAYATAGTFTVRLTVSDGTSVSPVALATVIVQ